MPHTPLRTFILENDAVVLKNDSEAEDIYGKEAGYPDYKNIHLDKYFSVAETINKMHKLWSEKGFLKLRMASGCYHHKCSFCDTKLQYICEYKPLDAGLLVTQIEKIIFEKKDTSMKNMIKSLKKVKADEIKSLAKDIFIREKIKENRLDRPKGQKVKT